jgi:hypothetical protein
MRRLYKPLFPQVVVSDKQQTKHMRSVRRSRAGGNPNISSLQGIRQYKNALSLPLPLSSLCKALFPSLRTDICCLLKVFFCLSNSPFRHCERSAAIYDKETFTPYSRD